jgi:cytoskeletal protein CcmA (bactofilin family)
MFKNTKEDQVSADVLNSNNNIGKGTTFTGNIETPGNIRIEGKIVGDVNSRSKVVVGPTAEIDGNINSQTCEVEGHVKGSIKVQDLLVLKPTCKVEGDIETGKLVVESGANFYGKCKMGNSGRMQASQPVVEQKDAIQKNFPKAVTG